MVVIPCLTEKVGKFQRVTSKFLAFLGVKSNGRSIFQLLRLSKVMGCYISQLLDALKVTDCYIFQLFSTLKVMALSHFKMKGFGKFMNSKQVVH